MAEPAWMLFVFGLLLVTGGVVGLARISAASLTRDEPLSEDGRATRLPTGLSLLYNLALTHLLIAGVVLALVWLTGVPFGVLGLSGSPDVISGVLLGLGVFAVDEGITIFAKRYGVAEPERLRRMLAPETRQEWVVLLLLVLPAVAVSEELLFRGALIGGLAAGTSLSPWIFVVVSTVAFGFSHTAQGWMGVVVTGVLGGLFGVFFVITGDLIVLVVAHYLVDAFEFLVHEGISDEWWASL